MARAPAEATFAAGASKETATHRRDDGRERCGHTVASFPRPDVRRARRARRAYAFALPPPPIARYRSAVAAVAVRRLRRRSSPLRRRPPRDAVVAAGVTKPGLAGVVRLMCGKCGGFLATYPAASIRGHLDVSAVECGTCGAWSVFRLPKSRRRASRR